MGGSGEKDILLKVARMGTSAAAFKGFAAIALLRIVVLEAKLGFPMQNDRSALDKDRIKSVCVMVKELGLHAFAEQVMWLCLGDQGDSALANSSPPGPMDKGNTEPNLEDL